MISYPIFIYGHGGAGGSITAWMIKKLINPAYAIDDPVTDLHNAHNQPKLKHWHGGQETIEDIIKDVPLNERIVQCTPLQSTWNRTPEKSTIVIYASSSLELMQMAVFQKYKILKNHSRDITDIYKTLLENPYVSKTINNAFNIRFSDLISKKFESVLPDLVTFLGVPASSVSFDDILTVHNKWCIGNEYLISQHMKEINLGEVPND